MNENQNHVLVFVMTKKKKNKPKQTNSKLIKINYLKIKLDKAKWREMMGYAGGENGRGEWKIMFSFVMITNIDIMYNLYII